jgi:hypothetical protein
MHIIANTPKDFEYEEASKLTEMSERRRTKLVNSREKQTL